MGEINLWITVHKAYVHDVLGTTVSDRFTVSVGKYCVALKSE